MSTSKPKPPARGKAEREAQARLDADRVRGNRFRMERPTGLSSSKPVRTDESGNFLRDKKGKPLREAEPMPKAVLMARTAGSCRKVWNLGLDALRADLDAGRRVAGYAAL